MKRAIFPGTFDPFTKGHHSIVMRGLEVFDSVIIAIGTNSDKTPMWPLDKRLQFINELFNDQSRITVETYTGLTMNYCKERNATHIIRGLRSSKDFSYEQPIAQTNRALSGIETVFFASDPELTHISSTIVRDIAQYQGDIGSFLPD
ncbi:MAG: pantetheine-phosphate adenylyltransferase [Flavobacteriaceae bacterium]|nr:pantetheine-phosphate adenylyltransferase [Flavobacteriaceae bacterium]MDG1962550.1 pantetheine-phosphate adenylyltransferase [Flavobacteriaceae bacterium]